MVAIGEFLEALKQKGNFSGNYALEMIEKSVPADRWELTLSEDLTPVLADAILAALRLSLVEVRGYYETDEGQKLVAEEIDGFISDFGSLALKCGVELPSLDL